MCTKDTILSSFFKRHNNHTTPRYDWSDDQHLL